MLDREKHYILLPTLVNYDRKIFQTFGPKCLSSKPGVIFDSRAGIEPNVLHFKMNTWYPLHGQQDPWVVQWGQPILSNSRNFFFAVSATLRENKLERLSAASFFNLRKPTGAYSYGACTLKLFTTVIFAVS